MQLGAGAMAGGPDRSTAGAVAPGAGDLRCGVCARANTPDRVLCATCAADLATGRPYALWSGALDVVPDGPLRGGGRRRERAAQLLGGLAVAVAVVVGPLWLLEIGPFAPPARLEAAIHLAAGYPGPAGILAVDEVATTTTAVTVVDREVSPLNLIDGDVGSAWIGAPVDERGAGEVIDLVLAEPAWVQRFEIRNGDHRSSADYERSDRIMTAVLTLDGGRAFRVDLLDVGLSAQVLELPTPELTTRISLRVERVFSGTDPRGVALTELTPVGWRAGAADAALARERARRP
jgi:hypothetical protein